MINCIEGLENYALTGHTSRFNEDGLTAQQLLIKCAKTTKEGAKTVLMIGDCVNTAKPLTEIAYDEGAEELSIYDNIIITLKKVDFYSQRFYFLFAENSKSQIQLAGEVNNVINQSLKYIEGVLKTLDEIRDGFTADIKAVKVQIDSSYNCIYDDCSMTLLELAGCTAKNVNEFVKTVNMLEELINKINITGNYNEETLAITLSVDEDETIIL